MGFAPQRRAIFLLPEFTKWSETLMFLHFDLQMCISLQRRANFPHLNFKKWSEPGVFCTFPLENVLRATAACNFSTSQFQKVVRECQFFSMFTRKRASRHSGVQLFHIPTSKSGLELMYFVHFDFEMCFSLQRHFSSEQLPPHPPL